MIHIVRDNEYNELWCGFTGTWLHTEETREAEEATCIACLITVIRFGQKALDQVLELTQMQMRKP